MKTTKTKKTITTAPARKTGAKTTVKPTPAKPVAKIPAAKPPARKASVTTKMPAPVKAPFATMTVPQTTLCCQTLTSESIATRAYTLWEQAGRPHGRDMELWLLAEAQLKQETRPFSA